MVITASLSGSALIWAVIKLLNETSFEQSFERTVQCSGPQAHAATCLLLDLAHDRVTVPVFTGEGEQNVKGSGR
jgi:hypothetical protein